MKTASAIVIGIVTCALTLSFSFDEKIVSYTVNLQEQNLQFYWKDSSGKTIGNFNKLKTYVESKGQQLVFAMNGGMFKKDFSPQGLYVEDFKKYAPLDTNAGGGNFYLKPNGVFYIDKMNRGVVCKTELFPLDESIKFATQSGPMLVIDGAIHPSFTKGSQNIHIRNGVGILPDGKVIFALSKEKINLYDFAAYFKNLGCKNALYFDGFVSRAYIPSLNWMQTDGNFGVMIGVVE